MNARPNIPDWQHAENRKSAESLRAAGYTILAGATSWQVWAPGSEYIGGASTASGKCHGRYREANTRDFLATALRAALQHKASKSTI